MIRGALGGNSEPRACAPPGISWDFVLVHPVPIKKMLTRKTVTFRANIGYISLLAFFNKITKNVKQKPFAKLYSKKIRSYGL